MKKISDMAVELVNFIEGCIEYGEHEADPKQFYVEVWLNARELLRECGRKAQTTSHVVPGKGDHAMGLLYHLSALRMATTDEQRFDAVSGIQLFAAVSAKSCPDWYGC